jgi:hypothetical protein
LIASGILDALRSLLRPGATTRSRLSGDHCQKAARGIGGEAQGEDDERHPTEGLLGHLLQRALLVAVSPCRPRATCAARMAVRT